MEFLRILRVRYDTNITNIKNNNSKYDAERERERERETDRQTDRQTKKGERERKIDRDQQIRGETDRLRGCETEP